MAERDSWAVQAAGPTGMLDVEESRLAIGLLLYPHGTNLRGKSGFRPGPGTSPGLVSATGTPDGFVHVAPFQLVLQSGRATAPGAYLCTLDAIKDINILSTPADPTNPRNDLIIAQQSDTFYADGTSAFTVKQVVGTPAGSPADPTVTGSPDFVVLARVRVDANATTIVGAKITDLRTAGHANSLSGGLNSVALGGILPVASQAQRDALTGIYNGLFAVRTDLSPRRIHLYDGAAWVPLADTPPQVDTFAGSGTWTKPANAQTCHVRIQAPGGGGGGAGTGVGGQHANGGGGGGGGYSDCWFPASSAGATETITMGAVGAGGVGANPGTAGGNASMGALVVANGGAGGSTQTATATPVGVAGGAGGTAGTITGNGIAARGGAGGAGWGNASRANSGQGGDAMLGGGAVAAVVGSAPATVNGTAGSNYGGGGSGAATTDTGAAATGGAGGPGFIIIETYF